MRQGVRQWLDPQRFQNTNQFVRELEIKDHYVLSNITSVGNMVDCSHEEADTRMMINLEHALINGAQTVAIDSGDSDVLIILLGFHHQLRSKYNFVDVIIAFLKFVG